MSWFLSAIEEYCSFFYSQLFALGPTIPFGGQAWSGGDRCAQFDLSDDAVALVKFGPALPNTPLPTVPPVVPGDTKDSSPMMSVFQWVMVRCASRRVFEEKVLCKLAE